MIPVKLIEPNNKNPKRSDLLTLLCILSFIGSGLTSFSNFIISLVYDDLDEILATSGFDIPGIEEAMSAGRSFFVFSFIIYLFSFIGVYYMWRLKKSGFHIYSISQILLLILPSFFINNLGFPMLAVLVSAMFIILYSSQLRYMK